MVERILVPLDGSAVAENVLLQVRRLMRLHKAEVLLMRVVDVSAFEFSYLYMIERMREDADCYLQTVEKKLAEAGIRVRRVLAQGHPADAILDTAEREYASLIAISTHGRTGLSRFAFGSVAEKVLRASEVPVLAVRAFPTTEEGKPTFAPPEELAFRNILVPFDASRLSLQVAPIVKDMFGPMDARVHLLHVLEEQWQGVAWALPERPMKGAADDFISACLPTTTEVRKGDAASEILAACRERKIDLIAMTTHGRSGIARWTLGSVTEKVLRAATVPILVVRARKEAT